MMRKQVRRVLITAVVVLACLDARAAWAQDTRPPTRDGIRPSVTAGVVYDDNVFARPNAVSDVVFRVSPMVTATKTARKRTITGSYAFDAERYDRYDELNDVTARQAALFVAAFKPTVRRSLTVTGGFTQTNDPIELNPLSTFAAAGRRQANRWDFGSAFHQDLSRTTTFDATYAGNRDKYTTQVTWVQGGDLRLGHRTSPRSDIFVHVGGRRFNFAQLGGLTYSTQVMGGWGWHGRSAHGSAEGGVARTDGSLDWTGSFSAGRMFGRTDITGRYDRTTTTAVGIPGAIAVDHVELGFVHQSRLRLSSGRPRGFRLGGHVGAARNDSLFGETRTFGYGVEISRPLTNYVIFVAGYDGFSQTTLQGSTALLGGDIKRNRVSVGIQFSPWSAR